MKKQADASAGMGRLLGSAICALDRDDRALKLRYTCFSSSPWQKWFTHSAASRIIISMRTACEGMGIGTDALS